MSLSKVTTQQGNNRGGEKQAYPFLAASLRPSVALSKAFSIVLSSSDSSLSLEGRDCQQSIVMGSKPLHVGQTSKSDYFDAMLLRDNTL